jgi:hypothetical protein
MNITPKQLLQSFALVSFAMILIITLYGIVASILLGIDVVGQTFVDREFPPIEVFPYFYMKPVSWLVLAIVIFTFSMVELYRHRLLALRPLYKTLLKAGAFVVGAMSLYEVLWNFMFWSAMIAVGRGELHPDLLINPYPNPEMPWNIDFASKLYFAAVIVCSYLFYTLTKTSTDTPDSLDLKISET